MRKNTIRISFTGDLLVYHSQIKKSKTRSGYDFSHIFEQIRFIFNKSDYVIGNLETPLAGKEAGYTVMDMLFNTPDQFAVDVKNAGFTMLTTANNHCMDKGQSGLERTIDVLDRIGIDHTGTFKNLSDSHTFIKDISNVKFGFVSFTYGTNPNVNGYTIDEQNDYMVNLTMKSKPGYRRPFWKQFFINLLFRLPKSLQDLVHPLYPDYVYDDCVDKVEISNPDNEKYIINLKNLIIQTKSKADVVFVCLHSGGQFNSKIGVYTQYLLQEIRRCNVDGIIVNHPHCVLSSVFTDNHFEAWSLGNFCFTPNEGYFIEGVYGEYGIVVHLDCDVALKKVVEISFSVVKNISLKDGRSQVISVDSLYENTVDANEKEMIRKDLIQVISRFLDTKIELVELKSEYNIKEFK